MLRRLRRSGFWPLLLSLLLLVWTLRYLSDARRSRHGGVLDSADAAHTFSVHLVMATMHSDDLSWTNMIDNAAIGNLTIIPYVADDPTAPHHPAQNKGREATMYLAYLVEHYDHLPDLAIFTHAQNRPWHAEPVLGASMSHTLSRLDLHAVHRRRYANLRISWHNACPDWIDTTRTTPESLKLEEPWVRPAFLDNFAPSPAPDAVDGVPRYLAQPCCSQFAVARDALRAVPRDQYRKHLAWLLATDLPDEISGRIWEHLFQYLWTQRGVDCPVEWKALCSMYHICFSSAAHYKDYIDLGTEREGLEQQISAWDAFHDQEEVRRARDRIEVVTKALVDGMEVALERGSDVQWRSSHTRDLYVT